MVSLSNNEIVLGQLRARVEWETTLDRGAAAISVKRVQLVLVLPRKNTIGGVLGDDLVVLGAIEPEER